MALVINASGDQEHSFLGLAKNVSVHINKSDSAEQAEEKESAGKASGLAGGGDTVDISDEAYAMNASSQAEKTGSDKDKGSIYAGNMNALQQKKENAPSDPTDPDEIEKQIKKVKQQIQEAERKVKESSQESGSAAAGEAAASESPQAQAAKQQLAQYQALLSQLQMQLMQASQAASV